MPEANEHKCDACGGSGHKNGKPEWHRFAGHIAYPCFRCGRDSCPVCLGAGTISNHTVEAEEPVLDESMTRWVEMAKNCPGFPGNLVQHNLTPSEQSRADAMADAETLMLALYAPDPWSWARRFGFKGGLGRVYFHGNPLWRAREDARAAFRAVPGLRGE